MREQIVEEYLRILRETTDTEASLDRLGNIVYRDADDGTVVTVTEEEAIEIINNMYGGI